MSGVFYFLAALLLLVLGYFFYGHFIEKIFGHDHEKKTPAHTLYDGVDYVVISPWKIFLIQLLNIAGLGPIFGAISGALFGPAALLWIVFGCILGGAVHDYLGAALSLEKDGQNLPEIVHHYMGKTARFVLRLLCISLCALVGVVFVIGPAGILKNMTSLPLLFWASLIFLYYFLATVLPIQTVIGKIYPFFGFILAFMAIGVISMLFIQGYEILPNTDFFTNAYPENKITLWPYMFVTIACGAISGFHATQSPMMIRCMSHAKLTKKLFYGPMIAEGAIALIWATVGLTLYPTAQKLLAAMPDGNPAPVVQSACVSLLGPYGAIIALIGVVILPITSGDTALRSSRLMIADMLNMDQKSALSRYKIAIPLFLVCLAITQSDFQVVWRYFGWLNQVIAAMTLWCISIALKNRSKNHWVTSLPACFMTCVSLTYGLTDKTCLNLPLSFSTYIATGISIALFLAFLCQKKNPPQNHPSEEKSSGV